MLPPAVPPLSFWLPRPPHERTREGSERRLFLEEPELLLLEVATPTTIFDCSPGPPGGRGGVAALLLLGVAGLLAAVMADET